MLFWGRSFFCFLGFFLAAPRSIQDFSPPTRDGTGAPCSGRTDSQQLDRQGIPRAEALRASADSSRPLPLLPSVLVPVEARLETQPPLAWVPE